MSLCVGLEALKAGIMIHDEDTGTYHHFNVSAKYLRGTAPV